MKSTTSPVDVAIVVEDPGAANFVIELPDVLQKGGRNVHLVAGGAAAGYLQKLNIPAGMIPDCEPDAFLDLLRPRLLAIGTGEDPDSFGLRLIPAARARGIASIGLVDSSTHIDSRFRGRSANPLAFCPDTVIVPDTLCRDGLIALSLTETQIVVAGHPHWDFVRATRRALAKEDRAALRQRLFKLPDPGRPIVLFAAEISTGISPAQFQRSDDYTLTGSGASDGRTEIVVEEILDAIAPRRSKFSLVLRLHPKHRPCDLSAYAAAFDAVSQSEPSLEVVHAADAVVGMTSMLMIEAALMRRPTLAIVPREREARWLPTIAAGITPVAFTRQTVRKRITGLLDNPQGPSVAALDRVFPSGALASVAATFEALLAK
jgi:hypothetical protein